MATFTEAFTGDTTAGRERSGSVRTRELAPRGHASRDRPDSVRSGEIAPRGHADRDRDGDLRGGELASIEARSRSRDGDLRGGDLAGPLLNIGVVIPADFNAVRVVCVDPEGKRLTDVDWVMARGSFPTAARVDDNAEADLWLLRTAYTDFMAVANRDGGDVNYAWYSPAEDQEPITGNDDTGVIVLDSAEIKGFDAGRGVDFGGNLSA